MIDRYESLRPGLGIAKLSAVRSGIGGLTITGLLIVPATVSAQVGSGSPQASAHVQVQTKADDVGPERPHPEKSAKPLGQALDQAVAVLSLVPADPLFDTDPLRPLLRPGDMALNELRKSERQASEPPTPY